MKTMFRNLLAVALLGASVGSAIGQSAQDTFVMKRRFYDQGASATPVAATTNPFAFRAQITGLNNAFASGPKVNIPGGGSRTLLGVGNDFVFTEFFASQTALNAAYANGNYSLSLSIAGSPLTGSVALPAPDYPPIPTISNISALQTYDTAGMGSINWTAFASPQPDDGVLIEIRGQDNSLVDSSGPLAASDTSYTPASLDPGTTYNASITFFRLSAQDNTGLAQSAQFATETRFRLQTSGGGGGPDITPPQLVFASPTNGSTGVVLVLPVAFQFNEPMDPSKIAVAWNGLDGTKFRYAWLDAQTLSCTFTGAAPATATLVTWTLNPNPVAAGHIRDVAGNPLAQNIGSFTTQGTPGSGCTNQSTLEAAGFGLFKRTNHRQTGTGAPVEDATLGATFQAFCSITNPVNRAAVSFGAPPPTLQFLSAVGGLQFLSQPYANQAAMDGVYPSGTYAFQLRQPTNTVIASADLVFPASPYPNVPHFANYTAAQTIDTNVDFTLSWDAFVNATTNDSLHIEITDLDGNSLFSLPDPCSGPSLPATATSVVLPRGLLPGGQDLIAILTFDKSDDYGKTMPGTAFKGVAATSRVTRTGIHTAGGTPPPPPGPARFLSITKLSPTAISMTLTGSVNRVYVIESTATINAGWTPLNTNNAGGSGFFSVPIDPTLLAPRRFFRAIGR